MPRLPPTLIVFALAAANVHASDPAPDAPKVFAPGVISSSAHEGAPAFSPDGATVYFFRSSKEGAMILVSHRERESWSTPALAPFSGEWSDMEPAFAPDGSYLIFVSNRPIAAGGKTLDGHFNGRDQPGQGGNLWRVDRRGDGWSAPVRLPETVNRSTTIFAPSVSADGSVYFMEPDEKSGKFRLYRSQRRDDGYAPAEALAFSDGTATDVDPAIAPDESFIVFGSGRAPAKEMDIFIAFRDGENWSAPEHLGDAVNSVGSDAEARLSADHRTLYFSSERTTPIRYPRSREQAAIDLARITSWDNGQYNIWSVSLAPWLDRRQTAQ